MHPQSLRTILPRCIMHWWQGFISKLSALASDTQGALFVEYISLVVLVTLFSALLIVGLGVPLVQHYDVSRTILLAPVP